MIMRLNHKHFPDLGSDTLIDKFLHLFLRCHFAEKPVGSQLRNVNVLHCISGYSHQHNALIFSLW